jgi:hypothetical protein
MEFKGGATLIGSDFEKESILEVMIEGSPYGFFSRPALRRSVERIIRLKDRKIMAEAISYSRIGGGIAEIHPSSHSCITSSSIFISTFVRTN